MSGGPEFRPDEVPDDKHLLGQLGDVDDAASVSSANLALVQDSVREFTGPMLELVDQNNAWTSKMHREALKRIHTLPLQEQAAARHSADLYFHPGAGYTTLVFGDKSPPGLLLHHYTGGQARLSAEGWRFPHSDALTGPLLEALVTGEWVELLKDLDAQNLAFFENENAYDRVLRGIESIERTVRSFLDGLDQDPEDPLSSVSLTRELVMGRSNDLIPMDADGFDYEDMSDPYKLAINLTAMRELLIDNPEGQLGGMSEEHVQEMALLLVEFYKTLGDVVERVPATGKLGTGKELNAALNTVFYLNESLAHVFLFLERM